MKKIILLLAFVSASLQFFSCSTDYSGSEPENMVPIINIYDTSDITSSKKTKVQWYGNDADGTKMTYYYSVTTDTTLTKDDVLTAMPLGGVSTDGRDFWTSTDKTYAYVSMPYGAYPDSTTNVFWIDTVYTDPTIVEPILFKAVFSKFFVIGKDENGAYTDMTEKLFRRTNRIPKHPMVFSSKLGVNGYDKYWMTVGPDSAQMILPETTSFWKPIDFKWMGEDPDGTDVDLEFRWELWERNTSIGDSLVMKTASWSMVNLSANFDDEIYNNDKQGKYSFRVFVRDDAFEESDNHATVNFEVYAPKMDKGILFINDTDPILSTNPSYLYFQGNPDGQAATDFYKQLLEDVGFTETDTDPFKRVAFEKFTVQYDTAWTYTTNVVGEDTIVTVDSTITNFYSPNIRKLSEYRLVVIASDDRNNERGVDFNGNADNLGYSDYLARYLDVGGKVFLVGSSVMMKNYPYNMEASDYIAPVRQVFDPYAPTMTQVSNLTKTFFRDYFGIYSMTFPETKTWFCQALWNLGSNGQAQTPVDYYFQDNYDFIGVTPYEHISDPKITAMGIDSTKVNDCWVNYYQQLGPFNVLMTMSLKENGSVLTGIPTMEAFKGETVYKYKSIYDLPKTTEDPDIVYDTDENGTTNHSLKYIDPLLTDGDNSGYITRRSGSIATRYISEGDIYRTAFFSFPLYFMDNRDKDSDGVGDMTGMFNSMIDWFDLEIDPLNK